MDIIFLQRVICPLVYFVFAMSIVLCVLLCEHQQPFVEQLVFRNDWLMWYMYVVVQ